MAIEVPELMKVAQVAAALDVKLGTAYQVVAELDPVRIGRRVRLPRDDFERARADGRLAAAVRAVAVRDAERTNKRKYGLTLGARDAMVAEQTGRCAICAVELGPFGTASHSACVDHCHASGAVRGILCSRCNKGLGHFRDRPEVLERAAQYLRRTR